MKAAVFLVALLSLQAGAQTLTFTYPPEGLPQGAPLTFGIDLPYRYTLSSCEVIFPIRQNPHNVSQCKARLANPPCNTYLNLDGRWYPLDFEVAIYEGLTQMSFPQSPVRSCTAGNQPLAPLAGYTFNRSPEGATALLALSSYILTVRANSVIQMTQLSPNSVGVYVTSESGNVVCTDPVPAPVSSIIFANGFE